MIVALQAQAVVFVRGFSSYYIEIKYRPVRKDTHNPGKRCLTILIQIRIAC